MKIVIPDELQLEKKHLSALQELTEVTVYEDKISNENEIIKRIGDAEIITVNYFDLTRNIIENVPNLKYVVVPAVGYDWIDIDACNKKGIAVQNCPTFNSNAVVEHAIGLIFAVARKIVESNRHILDGKWIPSSLTGTELQGKKLLTIGYGNIGKKVYKLAQSIGMEVDYANTKTSETELEGKIKNSDIVVLCYPLNESTKGSFNKSKMDLLSNEAILINVGRGLLLDQDYLKQKLENKEIFGAGLDVFNKDETLREGREDIMEIARLENVVATPHIGFNSKQAFERLSLEVFENIKSILDGNPINLVNK
jgi:lactate dehydrogenase-like 2-hydroxyacid dehydrogenase